MKHFFNIALILCLGLLLSCQNKQAQPTIQTVNAETIERLSADSRLTCHNGKHKKCQERHDCNKQQMYKKQHDCKKQLNCKKQQECKCQHNPIVIDVRTLEEFNTGHLANAINVDWKSEHFDSLIVAEIGSPESLKHRPIIVYCLHGIRSLKAAERMADLGYSHILNFDKGIENWIAEGRDVVYDYNYKCNDMNALEEISKFVKDCGYYMIATADNHQPRVRPFGTINIFDGKLYIQTGHKKRIAQQLACNPYAEICAYNQQTGAWIRISGKLIEDPRIEAKKDMLDHYPNLRNMYDENDDNTAVYFFAGGVAYFSSFTEPEREVRF